VTRTWCQKKRGHDAIEERAQVFAADMLPDSSAPTCSRVSKAASLTSTPPATRTDQLPDMAMQGASGFSSETRIIWQQLRIIAGGGPRIQGCNEQHGTSGEAGRLIRCPAAADAGRSGPGLFAPQVPNRGRLSAEGADGDMIDGVCGDVLQHSTKILNPIHMCCGRNRKHRDNSANRAGEGISFRSYLTRKREGPLCQDSGPLLWRCLATQNSTRGPTRQKPSLSLGKTGNRTASFRALV
jgi:hypothetical protein